MPQTVLLNLTTIFAALVVAATAEHITAIDGNTVIVPSSCVHYRYNTTLRPPLARELYCPITFDIDVNCTRAVVVRPEKRDLRSDPRESRRHDPYTYFIWSTRIIPIFISFIIFGIRSSTMSQVIEFELKQCSF